MARPLDGNQSGAGDLFLHQLPVRQGRCSIRSPPDQKRLVFDIGQKMGQVLIDRPHQALAHHGRSVAVVEPTKLPSDQLFLI